MQQMHSSSMGIESRTRISWPTGAKRRYIAIRFKTARSTLNRNSTCHLSMSNANRSHGAPARQRADASIVLRTLKMRSEVQKFQADLLASVKQMRREKSARVTKVKLQAASKQGQ